MDSCSTPYFGKRALDVAGALAASVVLAPLMGAIAGAVYFSMGWPILFTQMRPGLHGKLFKIYKFRTMRQATDCRGRALADEARLTHFGAWLRSTSADELPELFNVLRGEMSLVGPRPLLPEYLPLYTKEQARRHDVRPGITGWAQISGRNSLGWEEKFAHDVWYVDHCSLALDLQILAKTLLRALRREGISSEGHATMPRFEGMVSPQADR